jgi:PAS domain S-box-containing protein
MRSDYPAVTTYDRVYQARLSDALGGQLDYYTEHVDLARFGGSDYPIALRDFLKEKYKGAHFDLIIAVAGLRNFLARYGAEVFPDTPVIFSISDDAIDDTATPENFTGVIYETELRGTLDMIRRLQPTARRVFVITGAAGTDKWHEARARKQFEGYGSGLELTHLSGLPLNELKRRVSELTEDSVIYFLMMAEDGAGRRFAGEDALDQIALASSVPIYTWHDVHLGHSVVGGMLVSAEKTAGHVAELALRVLGGERPEAIPIAKVNSSRLAFDWRQLQRWKLNEDQLPAGAEILFREATFWQRYKSRIIGVAALMAIQSGLILALLVERRRRRTANIGLKESEARYRNVVDTQIELICRFLPDTTLTFVNDAYCKYFGRSADELVGTKFIRLIPEAERDSVRRYIESLPAQTGPETWEHPVIRADGSPGWQQWTNSVISPGTGAGVELQGVGRDISERKLLEEQLIKSEREFSTLVENSPDVICRLGRDLRYIYASPNVDAFFGVTHGLFLGKRPGEVSVPDVDATAFECRCREAIDTEQPTVHEFQYRDRRFRTRIIPECSSSGAVESVMTISEDCTERLRAETELRSLTARIITLQDEERRRIARELHDGAAQNIAAMSLNLLRLKRVTSNAPEITKLVNDSQQLVTESLTELRTLSYLLHPPMLDHAGLARALQELARGFSERSGIRVETEGIHDIGRLPMDLETALFRVVQESLTNVHRHSGSGTASIRLERKSAEIRLEIADHGRGLSRSSSRALAVENAVLGVGISGMRERLIQLGGRLEIQSGGNGTTITAVAPATQRAALRQRSGA